jgi:hypothetical protein
MRLFQILKNPFRSRSNNTSVVVPTTHQSVTHISKIVPATIVSDSALSMTEACELKFEEHQPVSTCETYPIASPLLISCEESETPSTHVERRNEEHTQENAEENTRANTQENTQENDQSKECCTNILIILCLSTWFIVSS